MIKYYFCLVLAGVVIPLIFQAIFWLDHRRLLNLEWMLGMQKLMLIFWPSSLMLLPAASDENLYPAILVASIAVNVILYMVIGTAVWYGIKKNFILLVPIIIIIGYTWWKLLTL
jgi:hypothetical protein